MALDDAAKKTLGEHLAAIAALNKVPAEDEKEIAEAVKTTLQPVYQIAFRSGLNKGKEEEKANTEKVTGEKKTLEEQLVDARTKLTELEKKSPDVTAVRTELEGRITALKEQQKIAKEQADKALDAERIETAKERVRGVLESKHGVTPIIAKAVVADPDFAKKLRNTNGKWEVLGADGVPEQLADGTHPLEHYAAQLEKTVEPDFKKSKVEAGSGDRSKPGAKGGTNKTKEEQHFESIREDARAAQAKAAPSALTGLERLAGKRTIPQAHET